MEQQLLADKVTRLSTRIDSETAKHSDVSRQRTTELIAKLSSEENKKAAAIDSAQVDVELAQADVAAAQSALDAVKSEGERDGVGITSEFLKVTWSNFLKRFWHYRIGRSNLEEWLLAVNYFMSNNLADFYKVTKTLAESVDLSARTMSQGGGSGTVTASGSHQDSTRGTGDTESLHAEAVTPQTELDMDVRALDYANGVSKDYQGQESAQDSAGRNESQQTTNNTTGSTANTLDPLERFAAVLAQGGRYEKLWQQAINAGLFDLNNI